MKRYVDLHIHSCLSPCGDGEMTPYNITRMAALKGLDAIAVTDHNAVGNLPAVALAAQEAGITLLPGIEVTTSEEVHLLCYFAELEAAMAFGQTVHNHLPDVPNDSAFFGRQLRYDHGDRCLGEESRLLISSTDLSLAEWTQRCNDCGGIAVPAHIGRSAGGILKVLGFLPPGDRYAALEVGASYEMPPGDFSGWNILWSSDAHYLGDILERVFWLETKDDSCQSLLAAISGKNGIKDAQI